MSQRMLVIVALFALLSFLVVSRYNFTSGKDKFTVDPAGPGEYSTYRGRRVAA